jgi:hypothetical protein
MLVHLLGMRVFMTSLSGIGSSSTTNSNPLQKLQDELQKEVSSGAVGASDETALSSALTSIDSSLSADRQSDSSRSDSSSSGSDNAKPGDIKSKIDDLIQAQVSNGALTSDQATELKTVFSNAFGSGQDGPDGAGGPQGAGGPPPGPPPSGGAGKSDTSSSSDDSSSTDSSDVSSILQDFLNALKDAQSSQGYGATGASSTSSSLVSSLLDYQA